MWNATRYQEYSDDGAISKLAWQQSCWMDDHYPVKCVQDGNE
eukprot:CAMPEP_0205926618 /NCGR_PEP_ID=MMETSP1325-20131115/20886_1 /ASSEMBLY_ACC=CAM_ASM_000708 /TAXON_ID=236786 /ORGANISM="Florenciella sp., Strain RCC1007" /LENGTH=41 /DNA_ID= /DNA_START= /DNA_END= /DNA_ORIENTATION=